MEHFVSKSCAGETCGICWRGLGLHTPASHKVGEEIPHDEPKIYRHNLTQYVCCLHFAQILGPAAPCHPKHLDG